MKYLAVRLYAIGLTFCSLMAQAGEAASPQDKNARPAPVAPLEEIVVSANRMVDHRTLERVVVPFVESHVTPSPRFGQISRWYEPICPQTIGLKPLYNEFISRRVVEVARRVRAPTRRAGSCTPNIEILFSFHPQEQLDYIASKNRTQLGYSEHPKDDVRFSRAIQVWYVTGTQAFVMQHVYGCDSGGHCLFTTAGITVDNAYTPVTGDLGFLADGTRSEFVHATVIADANALIQYPLQAVGDYIAMLVLTRTALNGCNPLPSVIDLLSADCGARQKTSGLTEADTAYLKALYSSNLELKVNFERGEMRSRMVKSIETR
jgi:hypothetical protein